MTRYRRQRVKLINVNQLIFNANKYPTFILVAPSTSFDDLPPELVERILEMSLRSCGYYWPGHVVSTFQSLINVGPFWKIICNSEKFLNLLPRIYIPCEDILPKARRGQNVRVNMQRIIKNAGSFSGLSIELKRILNHPQWNNAWLTLRLIGYGWFLIFNIEWKSK